MGADPLLKTTEHIKVGCARTNNEFVVYQPGWWRLIQSLRNQAKEMGLYWKNNEPLQEGLDSIHI